MRTFLICPKCRTNMFQFGTVEGGKQVFKCTGCGLPIVPTNRIEFLPEVRFEEVD